jgi:hypothetical protein
MNLLWMVGAALLWLLVYILGEQCWTGLGKKSNPSPKMLFDVLGRETHSVGSQDLS